MSASSSIGRPASVHDRRMDQQVLVVIILTVAAVAWTLLAVQHGDGHTVSPGSPAAHSDHGAQIEGSHDHHPPTAPDAEMAVTPGLSQAVHAVAGWGLMIVAMMLPPALPLFQTVSRLVSSRPMAPILTLVSAVTFVAAWTVVGVVLITGYFVVRTLTGDLWAGSRLAWVAGVVILLAGVYQFTPLKDLCLRGCRSPRSFVLAHWQGRRTAPLELFRLTGAYAMSCIGCCWALMLICFAVGTAALPVMVALTVVMAAERLASWGRRLVRPVGAALVVVGLAMVTAPTLAGMPLL